MRKIYLLMLLLPSIFVFSQGGMDFEDPSITLPGSYGDGTFTYNGVEYTYNHSRDQDDFPINGQGLLLRNASDSYFEMEIPDGVGELSFQYRKAYTGGSERELEVIVNGVALPTTTGIFGNVSGELADIFTYTANINLAGAVTIRIKNVGSSGSNRQSTIDNIVWTANGGTSTSVSASTSLLSGFLQFVGTPSAEQTVDVSGMDLTADAVITVTSGDYEISSTSGSGFGASVTLPFGTGTIAPTTIYIRLNGGAVANPSNGELTITSAGATDVVVALEGEILPLTPSVIVSETTITGFSHFVGTPSAADSFMVEGFNLTDDITVSVPTNFEVSETLGGTYSSSVILTQSGGAVASTKIYVRLNGPAKNLNQVGDVTISSTDATDQTIALTGETLDYTAYSIGDVTGVDADGVADSVDVYVILTGVVHCGDFRNNGYDVVIIDDNNDGITLFNFDDLPNYTAPVEGDSLEIKGQIGQFNGLIQVIPNEITVLAQGAATQAPTSVTTLDETTESQYIQLDSVTLVNGETEWTGNTNFDVTDGTTTFSVRVPNDASIAGTTIPNGPIRIIGVGKQFDSSSPFDSGYQIFPCRVTPLCTVDVTTALDDATITATATGLNYQWIDCSDNSIIVGETGVSYTATVSGSYAVIITDGTCVDTSTCVTVNISSLNDNDFAGVKIYPNPVKEVLNITNENGTLQSVEVVSATGSIVYSSTISSSNFTVNTAQLNAGVYFVNVRTENSAKTFKVIK